MYGRAKMEVDFLFSTKMHSKVNFHKQMVSETM